MAGAVAAVAGAGGGVALAAAHVQAGLPWWDCLESNSCRRGI